MVKVQFRVKGKFSSEDFLFAHHDSQKFTKQDSSKCDMAEVIFVVVQ